LSIDLTTSTKLLVQACFDRWQIEVNTAMKKTFSEVGQAEVWA
jgi:hypothetical protein